MNLENWRFTSDSALNRSSQISDCSVIFHSVCDELGKYYESKGFKYARSGPHLSIKSGDIKLKIAFHSSRSNIPGESVSLEIIPTFESISLAKNLSKETKENGFLFSHIVAFQKYEFCENECDVIVRHPFNSELRRSDPNYKNLVKYSNNINVYGLSENNFVSLVNYINQFIVEVIDILQDENKLYSYLKDLPEFLVRTIFIEKRINSKLPEYIALKFPETSKVILHELSAP